MARAVLSIRLILAYTTVTLFLIFFFLSASGVPKRAKDAWVSVTTAGDSAGAPDFSVYRDLRTLSPHEFPIDDESKRVIVLGDIHGMYPEFQALLSKLSYDSTRDVLISTGDILAKGPLEGSLSVLTFMQSGNVTAVRGNHDQKAIEWRSWINWINSFPAGKRWLRNLTAKFLRARSNLPSGKTLDPAEWVATERKMDRKRNNRTNLRWWKTIPSGWKMFQDHYFIAAKMSEEQYDYLVSRPLRIHILHAHTYIAHAGVLASNPKKEPDAREQPLANMPTLPKLVEEEMLKKGKEGRKARENALRALQEVSVLRKVPQNTDPWVTLNMRGVLKNDEITRKKDGTPWSNLYKHDMSLCGGYDQNPVQALKHRKNSLPCHPATVIYGHAAARGLDLKRWTIGLDSGCVYKRRLSSLVLGGRFAHTDTTDAEEEEEEDEDALDLSLEDLEDDAEYGAYDISGNRVHSVIRFGDHGKGKIVSISCK